MEQLDAETCLVAAHVGEPGQPSAVLALVRQIEGLARDNTGRWPTRSYVVSSRVFDGMAAYDQVLDTIADVFNEKRFTQAPRRHAVVSVGAQDFSRDLRRRGVSSLTQVAMSDARGTSPGMAPGPVTPVGKVALVGALMRAVQRDLVKVIVEVEDAPGLLDAMRTLTLKSPRPLPAAMDTVIGEPPEDPRILALQVAAWKLETMSVRLPGENGGDVAPMPNPFAKEER